MLMMMIYSLIAVGNQTDYLKIVDLLSADDPAATLTLRVNEQRIPGCHGDDDAILYRQLVVGQALKVPLADRGVVNERRYERQVNGVRYAALLQFTLPRVQQFCAEFLIERTSVRQESSQ